ncbi:MAG: hypothetical protein LBU32_05870 [Clostridiales bacterium]|nr:hypothetical protein [Clostridiales bacterium]
MINEKRIMVMTKLAIYDKHYGAQDKRTNEFFRHDFIYKKNMWTRLCAFLGSMIALLIYWLNELLVKQVDILSIDFRKAGIDAAVFILIVMAAYTLIGTITAARQYAKCQTRLKNYVRLLVMVDKIRPPREQFEEETNLYYEGDIASTRSDSSLI